MTNYNENEKLRKTDINWYPGHMAKAKRLISENLNLIDIVFEIIDSRMPYSSKIKDIDELIKNKKKIIIFNKYDLCDKKETDKWIKYYQGKGLYTITTDLENSNPTNNILKILNNILRDEKIKRREKGLKNRRDRILIVGIPNVGKSTLINRLVGKKAVSVGNKPGVTKSLDWIRINDNLELLDTPGILWPKLDEETVAFNLASLSAIKEEILPIYEVVCYILTTLYKYYPNKLKERYNIDRINEEDMVETLDLIGKRRGCVISGGEIDYDRVMNLVLNDLKSGLIKEITFDRYDEMIKND